MIVGLIRPSGGSATVLGRPAGSAGVNRRVGALIEGPGFYPYLNGRDNLRVLARYRRIGDDDVERVLERVDLAARAGDPFKTYSLGMKQRLGVAAALLGDFGLLILDEPTNGLDPAGVGDMRLLLAELAGAGHTVLLSSHMLSEVEETCDRVGVINKGRLVAEATVGELRGAGGLRVRAEPVSVALDVSKWLTEDHVTAVDGVLHLRADPGRAAEITRALVAADVDVHEIRPVERSLEEVFFEMTTDEEVAR